MLGLTIELWTPGAVLPGVVGGVCLLLAFFALQLLPVNYAGLLLILFGLVLLGARNQGPELRRCSASAALVSLVVRLDDPDGRARPEFELGLGVIAAGRRSDWRRSHAVLVRLALAAQRRGRSRAPRHDRHRRRAPVTADRARRARPGRRPRRDLARARRPTRSRPATRSRVIGSRRADVARVDRASAGAAKENPHDASPLLIVVVIVVLYLISSIKILAEYERGVIFRLGKLLPEPKGPGVVLVFAPIDRMVRVEPADGRARRAAAGRHHARQRLGQGQRGRLLPRHGSRRARSSRSRTTTTPPRSWRRRRCAACSARWSSTTCCRSASA